MICKTCACMVVSVLTLLVMPSCGWKATRNHVDINVVLGASNQLQLIIVNDTPHLVQFDHPMLKHSKGRFYWELLFGDETISRSTDTVLDKNPLIPGHYSSGPKDVYPGGPLVLDLALFYPILEDSNIVVKADTFTWFCQVWDETATNWIVASGIVRIRPVNRL